MSNQPNTLSDVEKCYVNKIKYNTYCTFYKLLIWSIIIPSIIFYWGCYIFYNGSDKSISVTIYIIITCILTMVTLIVNFLRTFYNPYAECIDFYGTGYGNTTLKRVSIPHYKRDSRTFQVPLHYNEYRVPKNKYIRYVFIFFGLETYDENVKEPPTSSVFTNSYPSEK